MPVSEVMTAFYALFQNHYCNNLKLYYMDTNTLIDLL